MADVLVISGYGINCEAETAHAFERAGARPSIVHINDIISGKSRIGEFDIIVFPGGFSYGDDTGSGSAFANKIRNNVWDDVKDFISSDKLILGICNGFQIMVSLGLFGPQYGVRNCALLANSQNRYECRWVHIKHRDSRCVFTQGMDRSHVPVAHGEGRFYCDAETLKSLESNRQIVFTYCDADGNDASGFPDNPNGALANIAGICDKSGRLFGMMPHPERGLYSCNEPEFQWKKEIARRNGLIVRELIESNFMIFKNAVDFVGR